MNVRCTLILEVSEGTNKGTKVVQVLDRQQRGEQEQQQTMTLPH